MIEKTRNNRAWLLILPMTLLVAFSAIVPLTGTSSPTLAMMRRTVPAPAASSVPAILSVSMSASSSPGLTSSPSATIQPVILPSCIDSPHLGIVTATIRSSVIAATPPPS